MDTTSLRSAYAALLDLARTGEFGSAGTPTAAWDARHVVAHVAADDELLAAVPREVLAATAERYYNHDAVDQPVPWHRFMTVQASRHLPMHTEQLRALL